VDDAAPPQQLDDLKQPVARRIYILIRVRRVLRQRGARRMSPVSDVHPVRRVRLLDSYSKIQPSSRTQCGRLDQLPLRRGSSPAPPARIGELVIVLARSRCIT